MLREGRRAGDAAAAPSPRAAAARCLFPAGCSSPTPQRFLPRPLVKRRSETVQPPRARSRSCLFLLFFLLLGGRGERQQGRAGRASSCLPHRAPGEPRPEGGGGGNPLGTLGLNSAPGSLPALRNPTLSSPGRQRRRG